MICIIALPVFLILGIFSLKYRMLAKESFECVFRTITFRKCHSKLDQRIKSRVTGHILKYHPGAARFFFKNFGILSWIFTVLMVVSFVYSAIGIYNYAAYGNCNGPGSTAFCIFNPAGNEASGRINALANCTEPINTYSPLNKSATENGPES